MDVGRGAGKSQRQPCSQEAVLGTRTCGLHRASPWWCRRWRRSCVPKRAVPSCTLQSEACERRLRVHGCTHARPPLGFLYRWSACRVRRASRLPVRAWRGAFEQNGTSGSCIPPAADKFCVSCGLSPWRSRTPILSRLVTTPHTNWSLLFQRQTSATVIGPVHSLVLGTGIIDCRIPSCRKGRFRLRKYEEETKRLSRIRTLMDCEKPFSSARQGKQIRSVFRQVTSVREAYIFPSSWFYANGPS